MLGGNGFGAALGGHIGTRASELLDGRMSAEQEHRVRLHLGRCRQCAVIVAAEQDARAALRACAMPTGLTPPSDLVAGLMAMSVAPAAGPAGPAPAAVQVSAAALPRPLAEVSTTSWHRSPRMRSALAVSGLVAAGVTAAVTITGAPNSPTMRREAGSVARADSSTVISLAGNGRAFSQASFSASTLPPNAPVTGAAADVTP